MVEQHTVHTDAAPDTEARDAVICQLIRPHWTVVQAGVHDDRWLRDTLMIRPGARYLVFPLDVATAPALERALGALGQEVEIQPRALGRAAAEGQLDSLDQL